MDSRVAGTAFSISGQECQTNRPLRAFIDALEAFHTEPGVQIIILGAEAKRADPLTFPAAVA